MLRFCVFFILCLLCVDAMAVTKCVKSGATITHGGLYATPLEYQWNKADWSNVVGGIKYIGVAYIEAGDMINPCRCKIISPVITNWVTVFGPSTDIDNCSNACAATVSSVTYTIL